MSAPKITFIGAGSTVFVKNILGDVFQRPALKSAHIALMDIDETRLEESHTVVRKLMDSVGANGEISCHRDRKTALRDADFVVVAFQIGGYEPCTVTDFEVCKRHGLEQTIADTLGPGGIMRALRWRKSSRTAATSVSTPTCCRPTPKDWRRSRTCMAIRAAKTSSAMRCSKSWATLSPNRRNISPNTRHGLSSRGATILSPVIKCRWMSTLNAASSSWPTGIKSWRAIRAASVSRLNLHASMPALS